MDRGAWQALVRRVAESRTHPRRLSTCGGSYCIIEATFLTANNPTILTSAHSFYITFLTYIFTCQQIVHAYLLSIADLQVKDITEDSLSQSLVY